MAGYLPFIQFGATHSGHSFTQAGSNPAHCRQLRGHHDGPVAVREPGLHDVRRLCRRLQGRLVGQCVRREPRNSNKSVFVSTDQFIVAQTPLRPRVVGVQFGYKFY